MLDLYIALILSFLTGPELLTLCKKIRVISKIVTKYGKLFRITNLPPNIRDRDLKYFTNVKGIDLSNCDEITDAGMKHLRGIHTINLSWCEITGAGLEHLCGVHTIDLSNSCVATYEFGQIHIPINEGLVHLQGVHTINLSDCWTISDQSLKYLHGVHSIDLSRCCYITDAGLEHLKGCHTINLFSCSEITDKGLEHLRGVHKINLSDCNQITEKGRETLQGADITLYK